MEKCYNYQKCPDLHIYVCAYVQSVTDQTGFAWQNWQSSATAKVSERIPHKHLLIMRIDN